MDALYDQYVANLERASKISELNDQIIDYCVNALVLTKKQSKERTLQNSIDNHIGTLENLHTSSIFSEILPVIYGQQIVLMISAFEVYLSDIVRLIGNDYRMAMDWPAKINKQMDLALLGSSATTIGDLVLGVVEQNGISFQDLAATKRYFSDYLKITLEIDAQLESNFILATAIRHSYIHSAGVADSRFMKQIRNLNISEYKEGDVIPLDSDIVAEIRDSFLNIGLQIKDYIVKKINDEKI